MMISNSSFFGSLPFGTFIVASPSLSLISVRKVFALPSFFNTWYLVETLMSLKPKRLTNASGTLYTHGASHSLATWM